jgi:hypothetical protein
MEEKKVVKCSFPKEMNPNNFFKYDMPCDQIVVAKVGEKYYCVEHLKKFHPRKC